MTDSELQHFMGVYYGEDFETLWSGLDEYLVDDPPEDQRQLLRELDDVLRVPRSEAELAALLWDLRCYVYLAETPGGYRGWLEEIARRVHAHLGE